MCSSPTGRGRVAIAASLVAASILALTVTAAPPATPATGRVAPETVELALAFEPGAPLRHRMTIEQSTTQEISGGLMEVASTVILDVTHAVLDEKPSKGAFVLQTTIGRVRATVSSPTMVPVSIDSDRPAGLVDSPAAAAFGDLLNAIGRPLRYELTSAGAFVADASLTSIGVGQTGSKTSLRSFVRQMVLSPPKGPVSTGDSWPETIPGPEVGLPKDLVLTWSLARVEPEAAELRVVSEIAVSGLKVPAGAGRDGTMAMTGTLRGTATARRDGWISTLRTEQTTRGSVSIPAGAQPMDVPFSSTVKTTIETVT